MSSNFYLDVIQPDPRFHSADPTKPVADVGLLEPVMREQVAAFVAEAQKMGRDLRVFETYRSTERQQYVYEKGWSQLKTVGVHHYGLAADIYLYVDGKQVDDDAAPYAFFVDLSKKHGMISGIDWGTPKFKHTFVDIGHVQRIPVHRQYQLFAGTWYPSAAYNPYIDLHKIGLV